MTMVWDLFGIPANSNVPDADGNVWTVRSSEGWDAPDQRTQLVSPTGLHGQRILSPYAEGRSVVLDGLVLAPSEAAAWKAYDRLTSAMPGLGGSGDIIAYEPVPKSLTVRQAGPPRVSKPLGGTISYRLTLLAEYPWKRALSPVTESIAAGATGSFSAAGTFPAELEVATTSSGTVHVEQGGLAIMASSVPSGTVFTSGPGFDNLPRSVVGPGGEDLYSLTLPGTQWPAVVPGANSILNQGTAAVQVRYFPTYA